MKQRERERKKEGGRKRERLIEGVDVAKEVSKNNPSQLTQNERFPLIFLPDFQCWMVLNR